MYIFLFKIYKYIYIYKYILFMYQVLCVFSACLQMDQWYLDFRKLNVIWPLSSGLGKERKNNGPTNILFPLWTMQSWSQSPKTQLSWILQGRNTESTPGWFPFLQHIEWQTCFHRVICSPVEAEATWQVMLGSTNGNSSPYAREPNWFLLCCTSLLRCACVFCSGKNWKYLDGLKQMFCHFNFNTFTLVQVKAE